MAEDEVVERAWVRRVDAPLEGGALSLAALERVQTALYGAVGRDDAWPEALRVLAHEFDAHIALLVAAGQGQRDQSFYAAWNQTEAAARAFSDHWWQQDPWLAQGIAQGLFRHGVIRRGSDIVAPAALRASRYYREYLSTLPAEHLLACVVSDGSVPGMAPASHLSLFRRPDQDDFSAQDVQRLRACYPHLLRAFDLHWSHRRLADQVTLLHRFLDAFEFGVVMLGPDAAVLHANRSARDMAAEPRLARWLGSLPARVAAHEPLGPLGHEGLLGQGGGGVLGGARPVLMALALPVGAAAAQPGACMLLLTRYAQLTESALDFVMRTFALSAAEARLLPLLLRGSTPADMAAQLGIKLGTVRSQLSAIFAKTGSVRQQDLIRLLGSVPPVRL